MPHIDIPQELFKKIEAALPVSGTADQFVQQAVVEKLAQKEHLEELLRLANENRQAMNQQGLSEEEILADFESWRTTESR